MSNRAFVQSRRAIFTIAIAISALAVILLLAAAKDDYTINKDKGVTSAEVISAGSMRSAITFVTPDGVTHNPKLGVLYPTKLVAGQTINIEYAKSQPDLVRVAGRDARVAIIPTGSVVVITWLVALAVLAVLSWFRRRSAGGSDGAAGDVEPSDDAAGEHPEDAATGVVEARAGTGDQQVLGAGTPESR